MLIPHISKQQPEPAAAMLDAATEAIAKQPLVEHVAFASGACIPVARATSSTLPPPLTSFFEPFRFGAGTLKRARSVLLESLEGTKTVSQAEAEAWAAGLQLHHQWSILAGKDCLVGA
jgi:uncharacterized membrane protein YdfJ with MMPL/SSD domain